MPKSLILSTSSLDSPTPSLPLAGMYFDALQVWCKMLLRLSNVTHYHSDHYCHNFWDASSVKLQPSDNIGIHHGLFQAKIGIAQLVHQVRILTTSRTPDKFEFDPAAPGFKMKEDIWVKFEIRGLRERRLSRQGVDLYEGFTPNGGRRLSSHGMSLLQGFKPPPSLLEAYESQQGSPDLEDEEWKAKKIHNK